MKPGARLSFAWPWGVALGLAAFSGCSDDAAIVGGRCANGLAECGGVCLDLGSDPAHCGGCDLRCDPGIACVAGRCALPGDGSTPAADADGSALPDGDSSEVLVGDGYPDDGDADASIDDASDGGDVDNEACVGDKCGDGNADGPETGDDGPDGSSDVSNEGDDVCIPPYENAASCGACGVVCQGATPVCKPVGDGGFACAPFCAPEFVQCGSECKDLLTDENNCGACDKHCITGICVQGQCVGGGVGHVVLAGMNFRTWYQSSPQTRLFANSVFLPAHNPVRVLAWSQYGDKSAGGSVSKVNDLLAWSSTQVGRPYTLTDGGAASDVPALLIPGQQDVLLIHDQPNAPAGELATIGASWNAAVSDFVHAGGTILVLMSTQGQNEMPSLVSDSGLGTISSLTDITMPFHILSNIAPYDAIGLNVVSPFLARPDTATLHTPMTPSTDTVFVVVDSTQPDAGNALPVVIHRVVLP